MIPLVCVDVDGTLVGSSGVVTDTVWNAIDDARARGQHVALSTARGAFGSSWEMADRVDPDGWHVFHAGGAVVHRRTGEVRGEPITPALLDETIAIGNANGWIVELYSASAYAVNASSTPAVEHAGLLGAPLNHVDFDDFRHTHAPVVRVQYVVPVAQGPTAAEAVEATGLTATIATSPIMPGWAFVSVTRSGVTKATGIELVCAELGVTIDQVMMVGDGHNDLPAIAAVGHSVAMANATSEVLETARYRVGHVDDDGVAEALAMSAELDPAA